VSWEQQARCRTIDPEIFFAPGVRTERRAKAVCALCPVKSDCLSFALESRTEFGIWGGLNGKERQRMLRRIGTRDWRRDFMKAAKPVREDASVTA
jgi:WhiB family transcriptional regulator, redox-sensing transcriptional regulator